MTRLTYTTLVVVTALFCITMIPRATRAVPLPAYATDYPAFVDRTGYNDVENHSGGIFKQLPTSPPVTNIRRLASDLTNDDIRAAAPTTSPTKPAASAPRGLFDKAKQWVSEVTATGLEWIRDNPVAVIGSGVGALVPGVGGLATSVSTSMFDGTRNRKKEVEAGSSGKYAVVTQS
ncbi:hypothetical protein IWQ60_004574 [Tieghemiomyces parasiticus]|uniref:Uncharacterized protein n=1 Tax=Tieghemiomyces parasiticus TaxID=78921 RepID=A0A9W8DZ11_9FUNG|nr:hypothetical protein IWQ60_004574 [Tieghemiomyces parasiticus]